MSAIRDPCEVSRVHMLQRIQQVKLQFTYTTRITLQWWLITWKPGCKNQRNSALNGSSKGLGLAYLPPYEAVERSGHGRGTYGGEWRSCRSREARRGHEAPAHQCADRPEGRGRRFHAESPVWAAGLRGIIGLRLHGGALRARRDHSLRGSAPLQQARPRSPPATASTSRRAFPCGLPPSVCLASPLTVTRQRSRFFLSQLFLE